jgi:hypothetical protein
VRLGGQFSVGHMADANTHLDAKDGANLSRPFQVMPPPAYDQARTAPQPQPVGRPATGRKPLFRR